MPVWMSRCPGERPGDEWEEPGFQAGRPSFPDEFVVRSVPLGNQFTFDAWFLFWGMNQEYFSAYQAFSVAYRR